MQSRAPITVDGESGGGLILRYGFALAALASHPIHVANIRASCNPPGLQSVHLHCIQAVSDLCNGRVEGAHVGSIECRFTPGDISQGQWVLDTGSATSVSLLSLIALPCLLFASGPSTLACRGGTDVRWSPPIDELIVAFLPLLARFGGEAHLSLFKRGFFPEGRGEVSIAVTRPTRNNPLRPLVALDAGKVVKVEGRAFATSGSRDAEELQAFVASTKDALCSFLPGVPVDIQPVLETPSTAHGHGSAMTLVAVTSTGSRLCGTQFRGAEQPLSPADDGRQAIERLASQVRTQSCVDEAMQDQLVIYMALAAGRSEVRIGNLTDGAKSAIGIAEKLLPCRFALRQDGPGHILTCDGVGLTAPGRFTTAPAEKGPSSNPFAPSSGPQNPFAPAPASMLSNPKYNPFRDGPSTGGGGWSSGSGAGGGGSNPFGPPKASPSVGVSNLASGAANPFGPKTSSTTSCPFGALSSASAGGPPRPFDSFGGPQDGRGAADGTAVKQKLEALVTKGVFPNYDANLFERLMSLGSQEALQLLEEVSRRDMTRIQSPIPYVIGMIKNKLAEREGGYDDDRYGGGGGGGGFLRSVARGGGDEVRRMLEMLVSMGKLPHSDDDLYRRLMCLTRNDALDLLEEVARRDMTRIRAPVPYVISMIRHMEEERGGVDYYDTRDRDRGDRGRDWGDRGGGGMRGGADPLEVRRMLELLVKHNILPHFDPKLYDRLLDLPHKDAMEVLQDVMRRDMSKIRVPVPYVLGMIRAKQEELGDDPRKRDRDRDSDSDDDRWDRRGRRGRRDDDDDRADRDWRDRGRNTRGRADRVLSGPSPFSRSIY